jgi:hypothetical protein
MKNQAQTQRIAELIESAKQRFGDFSETKKQEIFLQSEKQKLEDYCGNSPPTDA